jgi:hypothetical protein
METKVEVLEILENDIPCLKKFFMLRNLQFQNIKK